MWGKKEISLHWGSCGYKSHNVATPTALSRASPSIQGFVWTANTRVSKYNLAASTQICLKTLNRNYETCDSNYHLGGMSGWPKEEEIRASSSIDGRIKIAGEMKQGREMFTSQKMRNLVWGEHMLCLKPGMRGVLTGAVVPWPRVQ